MRVQQLIQNLHSQNQYLALETCNYWYPYFKTNPHFLLNYSLIAYRWNNPQLAYRLWNEILLLPCPKELREMVFFNLRFAKPVLSSPDTWPTVKENKTVVCTITSCKRLNLLQRTLKSFCQRCLDIELIGHWICVDDNSSPEDREIMKREYPFIEFIFKDQKDKGHPQSMNILRNRILELKANYIFHLEDDFEFFLDYPYISNCIAVLDESDDFGQCLVNRNYTEQIEEIGFTGGEPKTAANGVNYLVHAREGEEFAGTCCAYWPHFSLRPGLWKYEILEDVGTFNENADHFEMDYANRYVRQYKTTFLDGIFCTHIGKKTHEKNILNAYDLNGEEQFHKTPYPTADKTECIVINLERRKDRLDKLVFPDRFFYGVKTRIMKAVDGTLLKPSPELTFLFANNDYNMRAGIVGCALSHLKLYKYLLESSLEWLLILEDDIIFNDWEKHLEHVERECQNTDLFYLGCHYTNNISVDSRGAPYKIRQWTSTSDSKRDSYGSTMGYFISRKGAQKMLSYIDKYGIPNAIDTIQQNAIDKVGLRVQYIYPGIVKSEMASNTSSDTDIQFCHQHLTLPTENLLVVNDPILLEALSRENKEFKECILTHSGPNKHYNNVPLKDNTYLLFPITKLRSKSYLLDDLDFNEHQQAHKKDKDHCVDE